MSLDRFRRNRLVVLDKQSLTYQAARAMADNHIGSVIVGGRGTISGMLTDRDLAVAVLGGDLDPLQTTLGDMMSEDVVACDVDSELADVIGLMRQHMIRRVPVTENGELVGLVTFDDLVLDDKVSREDLAGIVQAQLTAAASQKPAGLVHPERGGGAHDPSKRPHAVMRSKARADATYRDFMQSISEETKLDPGRAERATILAICMLCRRLTPREGQQLLAQLPSKMHRYLAPCLEGPDRDVTAKAIEEAVSDEIGVSLPKAQSIVASIFHVLMNAVSPGEADEVRAHLPEALRRVVAEPAS